MRDPVIGEPVDVYFNLHKRLWSIKARSGPDRGRIIAHAETVVLDGVELIVSEAGRQRVLREQRKNVHAFARGTLTAVGGTTLACAARELAGPGLKGLTYNPYRRDHFIVRRTGQAARRARAAILRLVDECGTPKGRLEAVGVQS